jgi:hypothetical protein
MTSHQPSQARILPFVPRAGLTFGIYHGGVVESHRELATGKPDSPDDVNRALDLLQSGRHFIVRSYLRFTGTECDAALENMPSIADLARYTWNGRKLDLVLSNWDPTGNMSRWTCFIERAVERYGAYVRNWQICEEPNLVEYPGDGRFSHSVEAVLSGVQAARNSLRRLGLTAAVGFNAVPTHLFIDSFWQRISKRLGPSFLNALDYVGLNLYPDVSAPLVGEVEPAVEETLTRFRRVTLAEAGIPSTVPMHICENGWPTGPNRFYTRQADMLERIVRQVYALRNSLNITQFELYSLRDADTGNPDPSRQFGIMRDDYTPKPAFETYRRLIQELGN